MAKKMLIDATHAEETRVVVVDGNKVEEFDFETINKRQLAGNIYLAKVTRVEPSLQAAFVDYGGNRHGFLAFAEIHPDYYQIPVADRQALLEEERLAAEAEEAEERSRSPRRSRRPRSGAAKAEKAAETDAVVRSEDIPGMAVVDLEGDAAPEGAVEEPVIEAVEADVAEAQEPIVADDAVEPVIEPEAVEPQEAADEADDASDEEVHDHDHHVHPTDDEIESVAEEDVQEEIRAPRKPRARRYKIQEVIKVRQIMLVQVVKEERGNKGAALTTYLSLAGRYCVLMPNTARGGGISRKITNAADRKKLKEIAGEMEVPQGAGLIIRTAGAQRTKTEIRRDYEYLMRLWEQIRDLTMKSVAPAPIYEEGDLIKRSIRDLYSKEIDEVLVEGERGYRVAKDFMKMIMPSHAKNVKHYNEQLTLFARYQVESYLSSMFNPVVQLKSGGYIVIGVTEALVAIDVNSGRATKEGSIEETALKTNLEAADEVARQLRLRDLAGLIVIDFIDMEERKNNAAVEKRLKERLKTDRARIQVGRISGFGLLEMSRQRLRPGMLESTTQPCPHCHGTGLIRSDDSLALQVLRAIEEEGTRKRSREVLVRCPVAVANYLMNAKREHIAGIEARYGMAVRIEADPSLVSPDFSIEKFKTATRIVPELQSPVVSASAELMAEIDEADLVEEVEEEEAEVASEQPEANTEEQPRKKKRRRRRKKRNGNGASAEAGEESDVGEEGDEDDASDDDSDAEDVARAAAAAELEDVKPPAVDPVVEAPVAETATVADAEPKKRASRSRKKTEDGEAPAKTSRSRSKATTPDGEAAPKKPTRSRKKAVAPVEAGTPEEPAAPQEAPVEQPPEAPVAPPAEAPVEAPVELPEAPQEAPAEAPVELPEAPMAELEAASAEPVAEDGPPKPKRRGWWSAGS
ncbi:Rne/Rng family ribonuclease [Sedimentimonas flavescens]|uniref:Rne/Rng family ribonuclease n=1 Tax=Sedimentimonas flavescens TaxID=2851012 RepID=UPI001C49EC07|nr:ribonuclease E/G [Sedimentimonas flavescens]MBW0158742.1 Rne/Rng family ribonuclease [Sedimentimonas flavescens]